MVPGHLVNEFGSQSQAQPSILKEFQHWTFWEWRAIRLCYLHQISHGIVFCLNCNFSSGTVASFLYDPAENYMFKANNRNTWTRCEIWTYLTSFSSVSIVNFEHVIAGCGGNWPEIWKLKKLVVTFIFKIDLDRVKNP